MTTRRPTDFKTSEERSQWITDNADYYTTFVIINRKKYGDTYTTLEKAEKAAHAACGTLHKPVMIYAAKGVESTWVKTIQPT